MGTCQGIRYQLKSNESSRSLTDSVVQQDSGMMESWTEQYVDRRFDIPSLEFQGIGISNGHLKDTPFFYEEYQDTPISIKPPELVPISRGNRFLGVPFPLPKVPSPGQVKSIKSANIQTNGEGQEQSKISYLTIQVVERRIKIIHQILQSTQGKTQSLDKQTQGILKSGSRWFSQDMVQSTKRVRFKEVPSYRNPQKTRRCYHL